jgi:hypothetical protein
MDARDLEDVMRRFIHGGFHVLVSTTIIENGIDIPNVMESKINSTGHSFGKEKTVQDIKSTKLLMILNLANAMDLMMKIRSRYSCDARS